MRERLEQEAEEGRAVLYCEWLCPSPPAAFIVHTELICN